MAYNTLYDYYQGQGQALPGLAQRGQLYQQYGLGNASSYMGNAAQNTSLLGKLQSGAQQSPMPKTPAMQPTQPYQMPATPTTSYATDNLNTGMGNADTMGTGNTRGTQQTPSNPYSQFFGALQAYGQAAGSGMFETPQQKQYREQAQNTLTKLSALQEQLAKANAPDPTLRAVENEINKVQLNLANNTPQQYLKDNPNLNNVGITQGQLERTTAQAGLPLEQSLSNLLVGRSAAAQYWQNNRDALNAQAQGLQAQAGIENNLYTMQPGGNMGQIAGEMFKNMAMYSGNGPYTEKNAQDTFFNIKQQYPDTKYTYDPNKSWQDNLVGLQKAASQAGSFEARNTNIRAVQNPLTGQITFFDAKGNVVNRSAGKGYDIGDGTGGGNNQSLSPFINANLKTVQMGDGSQVKYVSGENVSGAAENQLRTQAQNANLPFVNRDDMQKLRSISVTQQNLTQLADTAKNILSGGFAGRFTGSIINPIKNFLQTNPDISSFKVYRDTAINTIQALGGGSGSGFRLNQAEINTATSNLPEITDNLETAQKKISLLQGFIDKWIIELTSEKDKGKNLNKTNVTQTHPLDSFIQK